MLPSILEIANQHNLTLKPQRGGSKEVLGKCPFCRADEGKRNKHYLSLNVEDNVFRCWYCGEKGGVCRFESLLTGIPESEITEKYRGSARKTIHPAQKLTARQLELIGFRQKPNWFQMRKRDKDYCQRTRDWIWAEWKTFVQREKEKAFVILLVSILSNQYSKGIFLIQEREREIQQPFLDDLLRLFSQSRWPRWALEAKRFAMHLVNPSTPFMLTDQEKVELTIAEVCKKTEERYGFSVDPDELYSLVKTHKEYHKNMSKPAGQYQLPVAQ